MSKLIDKDFIFTILFSVSSIAVVVLLLYLIVRAINSPEPPPRPEYVGTYCKADGECFERITKDGCPKAANFKNYQGDVRLKEGTCVLNEVIK